MAYSTMDAIDIAETDPHREAVFFAAGFKTATPPAALAIKLAHDKRLLDFGVFRNHFLTPPAIRAAV